MDKLQDPLQLESGLSLQLSTNSATPEEFSDSRLPYPGVSLFEVETQLRRQFSSNSGGEPQLPSETHIIPNYFSEDLNQDSHTNPQASEEDGPNFKAFTNSSSEIL